MTETTPRQSENEINPYETLLERLWRKTQNSEPKGYFDEELELITRKLVDAIQENDIENYRMFNTGVARFFTKIRKAKQKDHISDVTPLQSAFYELFRLDTFIRSIRAQIQLPSRLEAFFDFPRREKLKRVFQYISLNERCGLNQITEDVEISRQHARNLCLQLQEYRLIQVVGRDGDGQTAPLLFGITLLGKKLATKLKIETDKVADMNLYFSILHHLLNEIEKRKLELELLESKIKEKRRENEFVSLHRETTPQEEAQLNKMNNWVFDSINKDQSTNQYYH